MRKKFNYFLSPGFIIACTAALLSVIVGLIYLIAYSGSVYLDGWAGALTIIAGAVYGFLIIFKQTRPFAATALLALSFIGFMLFINATYLYLSEVFFAGITIEAFANINPVYVLCVITYLLVVILSNVSAYLPTDRKEKAAPTANLKVEEESKA